jgi:pimeloyl-ACP methyl ester carboxylesterase
MAAAPRPRRVLLVHGAWHGAWCWERMLAPLRALGYEPEAIDLPGHGSSTEPLTDLHGDSDAVRVRLDAIGEPTLLVGHSYGGMVITDAGTHDAVAGLAYVAAYLPDTRPHPPPPATSQPTMKITIYGWRTRQGSAR